MKRFFIFAVCVTPLALQAQKLSHQPEVCWLETSTADMDGALGGAGLSATKTWHSTISAVLLRNPKGDLLVDTGLGPNAEAQMKQLPPDAQAFGMQVVAGAKDRVPLPKLLTQVGESPKQVRAIVLTHTHYDHLGGATTLSAPIYLPQAEVAWDTEQAAHPTITPPSLVNRTKARVHVLAYDSGPFLGFAESKDFYGDGSIVVVPLPGHTPGSQGVFARLGDRRIFLIGDASDTLEAAVKGLPKSPMISSATDSNPTLAADTTRRVAEFHREHPEIRLIPAHDRQAYLEVFPKPAACITQLPAASVDVRRAQ